MSYIRLSKYKGPTNSDSSEITISHSSEPTNLQQDQTFCKLVNNVKLYYGNTNQYMVDTESKYYKDVTMVVQNAKKYITKFVQSQKYRQMKLDGITPLIMSDMDDTIWCGFAQSKEAGFCYNPEIFNTFSREQYFSPIFPALDLLNYCAQYGIVPVFITGRAANQQQADMTSVQLQGFRMRPGVDFWGGLDVWRSKRGQDIVGPPNSSFQSIRGIFMHKGKDTHSGEGVTATVFKSNTRRYIEHNGLPGLGKVKFIASMGDQWSDSNGGNSGFQIKLPNPIYFLP